MDNVDKNDLWQYNSTSNFWTMREPTGVIPLGRWGQTQVTFGDTLIVFGGHTTAEHLEFGQGDMNEIWRFDILIGSLLADSKFVKNSAGWKGYQNEVATRPSPRAASTSLEAVALA